MPQEFEISDKELCQEVWRRLTPYRGKIFLSLGLLILSVPFVNFHPLVWGFVADHLVEQTLSPGILGMWLTVMFITYLIGLGCGAFQTYLLEKTGQAFVRDIRIELFAKFQHQS
ncbi:MAG: hypothetical protein AAF357_14760, partial [Verrucomicrobiota bacterium]